MFYDKLFLWHKSNCRNFPWRENITSYKIMIAEFMLNRTKVEQVVPIYVDFINRYPDIKSLYNADEKEIKSFTEHLGMHWRYKHFIESAKYLIENYNGLIPDNREKLLKIPGIGDYVAGAILTVAFNKPEYVIDSNIARFINRYYGLNLTGEIRRRKIIVEKAKDLFKINNSGNFLFAILDFTAILCKARKPLCEICFLKKYCKLIKKQRDAKMK
jgi:A/G-specific adenine glycosylase